MCGQSFCRWMEEEREVQGDVILLRLEGGSKVKLVETDVQEQCTLVQLCCTQPVNKKAIVVAVTAILAFFTTSDLFKNKSSLKSLCGPNLI